jgi:type IX secretion system PorP/SprF family membrane protein
MRIRFLTYLILLLGIADLFGQQIAPISLFDRAISYYNPAATGKEEALTANLFYNNHTSGFPGAQSTLFFTAHAPLKNYKMALGVKLEHESVGARNYTGFFFNYAYRIQMGANKLSLALEGGIYSGSLDLLIGRDEAYDYALDESSTSSTLPNFGVGALYYGKRYWISLSVPRILGQEAKESGGLGLKVADVARDYILAGGGKIGINDDFDIEPSALIMLNPGVKTKVLVNAMAVYKDRYKAGLGYKSIGVVVFALAFDINRQTSLAYSYDFNTGKLANLSRSSHEIHLRYTFGYKVNAANPRGF